MRAERCSTDASSSSTAVSPRSRSWSTTAGRSCTTTPRSRCRKSPGRNDAMAFPVVDGLRAIEFGTEGEMRSWLVDLVVNGNKRATAGLVSEYEDENEPIEHVGERLAILDNEGRR